MDFLLRGVRPGDEARVLELVVELAVYEREPDAVKASVADLTAAFFGVPAAAECLVAELGGEIVGIALHARNFSTWTGKTGLYLEDLYVSPSARGMGIGRAMLVELARIAVARGYARFEWSVLDWNAPAIRFYESLGARMMDEWTVMRVDGEGLRALAAG
ncbi:GNAT family N-acetyltransferase [Polymorphobacter multimanifer]